MHVRLRKLGVDRAFNDLDLAAFEALDAAWQAVQDSGVRFESQADEAHTREYLATSRLASTARGRLTSGLRDRRSQSKAAYLEMARRWHHLVRSYEGVESLERFLLDSNRAKGARPPDPPGGE
jgi:hypothetical protein